MVTVFHLLYILMSHSFSVIDCMLLYNVDKLARRYFSMGGTEQLEGQQSVRRPLVCKSVCVSGGCFGQMFGTGWRMWDKIKCKSDEAGVYEVKIWVWSSPSHTSLVTGVRTHSLHGLVSPQDAEAESSLLPQQVHLHLFVLRAWHTGAYS